MQKQMMLKVILISLIFIIAWDLRFSSIIMPNKKPIHFIWLKKHAPTDFFWIVPSSAKVGHNSVALCLLT